MAGSFDVLAYKELVLVLGTAAVVVPALLRLGINPVLGFLAAGAVLGPDGLGRLAGSAQWLSWITVSDRSQIAYLAEAGVVFLLFMIGLELSFERLKTMRRLVFGLGGLQVLVSGTLLSVMLSLAGITKEPALVLGFAFALSSTALVVQLLADQKRLRSTTGRSAFSILLFQDLAVVPLLVLVGIMGQGNQNALIGSLAWAGLNAAIAIGAILLLGRHVLRPLFRAVARTQSGDLFMAASLLVVIGTGLITAASGLSMALGAFIAGLVLAETEFRREVEATIEPFKGLLVGIFFFSVGMSLDIAAILANPAQILVALGVLLAAKAAIAFALLRWFKVPAGSSVEAAFLLAPAGEFAFVVLSLAAGNLVSTDLAVSGIAVASLSMILTPAMDFAGRRLRARVAAKPVLPAAISQPAIALHDTPSAIVVGYGRVGELVCDMLEEHKQPYVALDMNANLVARGHKAQRPVYYADGEDIAMLRRCGLDTAKVMVITMDNRAAVANVAKAVRAQRPDLPIVARARDPEQARQLYALGVTEAVPETIEASLHISEAALIAAGASLGLVIASINEKRARYRNQYQRIEREKRSSPSRLRGRRTALRKKSQGKP